MRFSGVFGPAGLVAAVLVLAGAAQAFFPSGSEVRKNLQTTVGLVKAFEIEMSSPRWPELTIKVWYQDRKWRTEWVLRENGEGVVVRAAVGVGLKTLARFGFDDQAPVPGPVLRQIPLEMWIERGLDSSLMAYTFLNGRPALVLGRNATEPLSVGPTLAVDNETWVPLALTMPGGGGLVWREHKSVGNILLPHGLTVQDDQGQTVDLSIVWRGVGKAVPFETFDPQSFGRIFGRAVPRSLNGQPYDVLLTHNF